MTVDLFIAGSLWKRVDVANPQPQIRICFMIPTAGFVGKAPTGPPNSEEWTPRAELVFQQVDVNRYELHDIVGIREDRIHLKIYQHRRHDRWT